MTAYYNEWDSQAAAWLRELIRRGHIAPGDVDERSITDVQPDEVKGYTQHHFFAGIGGWSLALRSAGWPDARPVFTGSPPCQPFSNAGRGDGYADERHLAPHWLRLVAAIRPAFVFGEQVAAAVKKDDWLDDLLDALEGEGYATGAAVLPACGVGAPHIRQRLWVVARLGDGEQPRLEGHRRDGDRGRGRSEQAGSVAETGASGGVAYTSLASISGRGVQRPGKSDCTIYEPVSKQRLERGNSSGGVADTEDRNGWAGQYNDKAERQQGYGKPSGHNRNIGMADSESTRLSHGGQRAVQSFSAISGRTNIGLAEPDSTRSQPRGETAKAAGYRDSSQSAGSADQHGRAGANQAGWDDPDWLYCRDGKWRPVESGTFPLADGLSARVGRLRAFGNAIVPQVAEEIIREMMHGDNE